MDRPHQSTPWGRGAKANEDANGKPRKGKANLQSGDENFQQTDDPPRHSPPGRPKSDRA